MFRSISLMLFFSFSLFGIDLSEYNEKDCKQLWENIQKNPDDWKKNLTNINSCFLKVDALIRISNPTDEELKILRSYVDSKSIFAFYDYKRKQYSKHSKDVFLKKSYIGLIKLDRIRSLINNYQKNDPDFDILPPRKLYKTLKILDTTRGVFGYKTKLELAKEKELKKEKELAKWKSLGVNTNRIEGIRDQLTELDSDAYDMKDRIDIILSYLLELENAKKNKNENVVKYVGSLDNLTAVKYACENILNNYRTAPKLNPKTRKTEMKLLLASKIMLQREIDKINPPKLPPKSKFRRMTPNERLPFKQKIEDIEKLFRDGKYLEFVDKFCFFRSPRERSEWGRKKISKIYQAYHPESRIKRTL